VMAWVLLGGAVATPARALPVRYTFEGTLGLSSGSDSLSLDGAAIRLVAMADTSDSPATTAMGSEHAIGFFNPSSLTATFSGRPNGLADETVAYAAQLRTDNSFVFSDLFDLRGGVLLTLSMPQLQLQIPSFRVFFDRTFFPGSDVAPLPVFGAPDLLGVSADALLDPSGGGLFRYVVQNPSARVEVIPEPGTAWLLALGLLALARWSRCGLTKVSHPIG